MLPDRFRIMLRGPGPHNGSEQAGRRVNAAANGTIAGELLTRRASRGLEQFFAYVQDQVGLSILDLSGATQENVNFITNLGHKLYSENFLRSLDDTFGASDFTSQANPALIERFLGQTLAFSEEQFDGVLAWDVLQYMSAPLVMATLDRLHRVAKPKSYLLAFFHSDEKAQSIPVYGFRIQDAKTLLLEERGMRKPAQLFNNRSLEKLFQRFDSVKFFLTREQLREVIIKK